MGEGVSGVFPGEIFPGEMWVDLLLLSVMLTAAWELSATSGAVLELVFWLMLCRAGLLSASSAVSLTAGIMESIADAELQVPFSL